MTNKYPEFKELNLTGIADDILRFWNEKKIFEQSISNREGKNPFVFFEGPPSANGMPGIHHVISRTLKDLVCRYKTMQGYQVNRKGGWDTHGLPVELGVEKLLGITKEDIGHTISVEEYNATCRREVLKYKDKWDELTRKMGYWVDLDHPYITFENDYIETLWWCLKQLYDKGYLYESVSIQPYSPAAGTGLSSHELNQPGTYKDVKDTSATVMFEAVKNEKSDFLFQKAEDGAVYFMAWTTTPWTLPSNLGLTVGPGIDYVLIKSFNPYTHAPLQVVLARDLVKNYFKAEGEDKDFAAYKPEDKAIPWKILATFKGRDLEGISYRQLMPFEANTVEKIREITPDAEPFKVITGHFVTTEDGTGIVHTAPAFGADDFKAGQQHHLGILTLVDKEGKFIEGVGEFSGRYVKDYKDEKDYVDVNVDISVKLKKEGLAFKIEKYEHNYPHCWRTDKPVIYYPLNAWFIKTTAAKNRMVELNKTINWKPASTGTGRFGNWLENMVDWNLSRSRFWGTPLPVWRTEDNEEEICIGSVAQLREEITKSIEAGVLKVPESHNASGGTSAYIDSLLEDLHKPFVDQIVLVSPSGKAMKRVSDLIDVWFDSGAMPYAQWHYPFENQQIFQRNFPADFIAEGVDQTRGWFYTLHVLGVLLFDSVAYKTVVSNGLVLDKNGNKMSKRLGNVVDPFETLGIFGADATRWYLITNASPWDNLKFDLEGIKEVQRKFFGTIYNTYQFYALYANVDHFHNQDEYIPVNERTELDRWIISELHSLIAKVTTDLNNYEPTSAGRAIDAFVNDQLSNWYVRLSRRKFWKPARTENGQADPSGLKEKIAAYQTLLECLVNVSKLMAPIAPFFADWLFKNLHQDESQPASVHLTDFPVSDLSKIDTDLENRMKLAQDISSLILSLRKKVNIKVRQPLQKVIIPSLGSDFEKMLASVTTVIKSETNIKEVELLPVNNDFIKKCAKANYKTLGKKLGGRMKWAANEIQKLSNDQIDRILNGSLVLNPDYQSTGDEPVEITAEDIEISTNEIPGYEIAIKGPLTVALDLELSEELKQEGYSRELVNRVQNLRKTNNLEITDKIVLIIKDKSGINDIISNFNEYICAEILARQIDFVENLEDGEEIEVNGDVLTVKILKQAN